MIRPRATFAARPSTDPECAGCPQLGTFRALRRAGLAVQGGLACDPSAAGSNPAPGGPWAQVTGIEGALALGELTLTGRRALVVAGPPGRRAARLAEALRSAGTPVVALDPSRPREAEDAVARAAATPGATLLALARCTRGRARSAPLAIAARRCNRCGQCLSLGCPAIADAGGEALEVDAAVCTGCGLCAPLCRSGAITPSS